MLPGALVAGPMDREAGGSWACCGTGVRSGDTSRELLAELPELSGSSVNAKTLGRRDDL